MDDHGTTPIVRRAHVTASHIVVELNDGREVSTPLNWYPRLAAATSDELKKVEISPFGVHWEDLDEDLSVAGMLAGNKGAKLQVKALEVEPVRASDFVETPTSDYEEAGLRNAEIDFPDLRRDMI